MLPLTELFEQLLGVSGKAALVTGAASGIGYASAELFARCGMQVLLADIQDLKQPAGKIKAAAKTDQVESVQIDVSDPQQCQQAAQTAYNRFGGLDVLVTSAGYFEADCSASGRQLQEIAENIWRVNTLGTMNCIEAVKGHFISQGSGAIVTVGSVVAHQGWKGRSAYTASKAAVEGITRAYALELAPYGVRVNGVSPGLVWTSLMAKVVQESDDPRLTFLERSVQQASGAMLQPEQVARHILALASKMGEGQCGAMQDLSDGRLIGHIPDTNKPGTAFEANWQTAREQLGL